MSVAPVARKLLVDDRQLLRVGNIPPESATWANNIKLHTRCETIVSRAPPLTKMMRQLWWSRPPPPDLSLSTKTVCIVALTTSGAPVQIPSSPAHHATRDKQRSNNQCHATIMIKYDHFSWIVFVSHSGGVRVSECGLKATGSVCTSCNVVAQQQL